MGDRKAIGRLAVGVAFVGWALVSIALALKMYSEDRYPEGIGWAINAFVFVLMACLVFIKPKASEEITYKYKDAVDLSAKNPNVSDDVLMLLVSTKELIEVERITKLLGSHGIRCVILDQHSSAMMDFLPDVEMRIMVPSSQYKNSLTILGDAS